MSSTNKTANYELSQYIGSDKPTYLVDYNGDMLKIDTGMAANKAQADATDLVVSGHTSSIEGLTGTVSDQGTAITGLRTDVDGNTGSINTINSLIGNGEPTTSDKTIIGAINELDADIAAIPNVTSISVSVVADGVKTMAALMGELFAAFKTAGSGKRILNGVFGGSTTDATPLDRGFYASIDDAGNFVFTGVRVGAHVQCKTYIVAAASDAYVSEDGVISHPALDVPADGVSYAIVATVI